MKSFGSYSAKLRGWFKILWRPPMKRIANMQPWSVTSLSSLIFTLRRCVWTHVIINKYSVSLQAEAFEVALILLSEIFVCLFNFFFPTQQFFFIFWAIRKFSATDFVSPRWKVKVKLIKLLRLEPDRANHDNKANSVVFAAMGVTFCYYLIEISNLGSKESKYSAFRYPVLEVMGTFCSPGLWIIYIVILTCML